MLCRTQNNEAYHKNNDIAGVHLCRMDRPLAGICYSTQSYLVGELYYLSIGFILQLVLLAFFSIFLDKAYCGIVFFCFQLPIYFIVSLGCYGLLMIGIGLMRFPTCPQEALLLQQVSNLLSSHFKVLAHVWS